MAIGPEQVEPVGHLQGVHARVRRHRRQPEAQHRPQVRTAHTQGEAPAQQEPQPEHDQRRGAEVAEQQPARALASEYDQHHCEYDSHRHVRA